jgi:8-oxo-dGTP diphosphatase
MIPPQILNGVLGLAFNSKHQALLTQRYQPETPEAHLKWQIPGGGQDFGEHPEETLKREMMEELGLEVEVLDPRPLVDISIWNKGKVDETHVNLLTYIVSIGSQTPKIIDVESNDWKWFDIEEIADLPQLPRLTEMVKEGYEVFLAAKS